MQLRFTADDEDAGGRGTEIRWSGQPERGELLLHGTPVLAANVIRDELGENVLGEPGDVEIIDGR
ncbi:MAG: hypothetical protein ACRDNZ_09255 [Streptosporangiaceae bacterium]